uniref:RUN domain-containing protein n=1 Tax=Panagrolaimus superbus TaxID=310955 RepID=A0A914ZBT6_9BILA
MPTTDMTDIPLNLSYDFDALSNPTKSAPSSSAASVRQGQSDDDSINNLALDNDHWTTSSYDDARSQQNSVDKVRELEEEHARLSDSILTLSSHFARIQFRLQQITVAPPEKRDELLKDLHDYAATPCLDLTEIKQEAREVREKQINGCLDGEIDEKRKRVLSLIRELKNQTEDLEKFAYENGGGDLPTSQLKQRQKMVFDKLQEKIQLNIELENLTELELQKSVDNGIKQVKI